MFGWEDFNTVKNNLKGQFGYIKGRVEVKDIMLIGTGN